MTARILASLAVIFFVAACQMPEDESQIEPEDVSEMDLETGG